MIVAIDVREAVGRRSGKSQYTFHVIEQLLKKYPKEHFVLYTNTGGTVPEFTAFKNCEYVVLPARGFFWHTAVISDWKRRVSQAEKNGREEPVYFAPTSFIVPGLLNKSYKTVLTVHDLIAFKEKTHQTKAGLIERFFARWAFKKAARIVVPSKNTAKDLDELFPETANKIIVTPLGVDESFFSNERTAQSVQLPPRYILTVGGLEPRKNITTLVDAFLNLPLLLRKYQLLIVGGLGWKSEELIDKIRRHKDRITHLSNISAPELPQLYKNAAVFVFPSLYEGFGLPPLEAMASGAPVICSNSSSLPEVCGDAALMVNPLDTADLTQKIAGLLNSPERRVALIQKGTHHVKVFTWERTAQETHRALMESAMA